MAGVQEIFWKQGVGERDCQGLLTCCPLGMMRFHGCGLLLFPGACLLGTHPKGQATVVFIPFIGATKNLALNSQHSEDSAVEDDHMPLQPLESC